MSISSTTEVQVNSFTDGDQSGQVTTALADGSWVVTWASDSWSDAEGAILQQIYDSSGQPLGEQTRVNVGASGNNLNFQVIALAGGGWLTQWYDADGAHQSRFDSDGDALSVPQFSQGGTLTALPSGGWLSTYQDEDGSSDGIVQTTFDHDGDIEQQDTSVNSTTAGDQDGATTLVLPDGGWVTFWASPYGDPDQLGGVSSQRFAADGKKVGEETWVVQDESSPAKLRTIALADGGYVVAWNSTSPSAPLQAVFQQQYDQGGQAVGAVEQITSSFTRNEHSPVLTALQDGGWVVHWNVGEADQHQQVYDAEGNKIGRETVVNIAHEFQTAALPDGGWLMVWTGDDADIYQQRYDSSGAAISAVETVNTYTFYEQRYPSIAMHDDGSWTITWTSQNQDGSGHGVYQRSFFAVNDAPSGTDSTIAITEDASYTFAATDFGFNDANHDGLSQIVIVTLPSSGALTLFGESVEIDQIIDTADIAGLVWSPTENANSGELASLMFRVVDDGGVAHGGVNTSQAANTITFVVSLANDTPVLAHLVADQSVLEDQSFSFQVPGNTFSDLDEGDTLTYGATLANGNELPSWLVFNPATQTFSGTPRNGDVGVLTVKVTATDGSNASVSDTFDITIGNVSEAPTGAAKSIIVSEDTSYTFAVGDFGFADIDPDQFMGITVSTLPGNASFTLDGKPVTAGQFIGVDDLEQLSWSAGANINGDGIEGFSFSVSDDGDLENGGTNTSGESYAISFNVSEVVDSFIGTKKKDTLAGTDGRDILDGAKGNDRLTGGLGDDTLAGGPGVDQFVFNTGDGHDTIMDFVAIGKGHDLLELSGLESITSFKDLKRDHLEQDGKHALIDGLDGDAITLMNVKIKDLDASNFTF